MHYCLQLGCHLRIVPRVENHVYHDEFHVCHVLYPCLQGTWWRVKTERAVSGLLGEMQEENCE